MDTYLMEQWVVYVFVYVYSIKFIARPSIATSN